MKASPAKRYRKPKYPDKLEVLEAPAILRDHVPSTWKRSMRVTGALAIFAGAQAGMLTGCISGAQGKHATAKHRSGMVAPIFMHGEGRGVTGCVVISPPVFLSEEEAAQVISETLAKAQITVSKQPYRISTAHFSEIDADIYSPKNKIAMEFVGMNDYFKMGGEPTNSSISSFDFQRVAVGLSNDASAKDVRIGIFYDPMTSTSEQSIDEARAQSKALLEAQVKDFIDWIKVQGTL